MSSTKGHNRSGATVSDLHKSVFNLLCFFSVSSTLKDIQDSLNLQPINSALNVQKHEDGCKIVVHMAENLVPVRSKVNINQYE